MVFCTYCGQPFFRAEHLKRHILTRKSGLLCCCYHLGSGLPFKRIQPF